jgi:4-amino-4-deoxy-L-arabinose transferase-like glycosyltransferase
MSDKKNIPFQIFTIGIFILLIVPTLIKDGMFMDGQQYACVAKNLANGLGTFWQPFVSATWSKAGSTSFLEHPPLVYGIQSLFFLAFGNSMYVERLYSLVTAIVSAFIISQIWKLLFPQNEKLRSLNWLPVLFWIIIPVCFWSYQNDMQENTMGIFTLSSVYFSLKALHLKNNIYLNLLLSGISVFAASFCKGVPGLFPLAAVCLYWLLSREISFFKMVLYTSILIAVPIIIYACLLLNKEAYESLNFYFFKRLLYRIHDEPTVSNRFHILYKLLTEMLPTIILSLLIYGYARIKSIKTISTKSHTNFILLFLALGLCGTIPIMLTLVQSGFYFVPALPFFAIGCALLVAPYMTIFIQRIDLKCNAFRYFKVFSFIVLFGAIVLSITQIGKAGRDIGELNDTYLFGKIVPQNTIVKVDESIYNNWAMQFYLLRYFNISEEYSVSKNHQFYIKEKSDNSEFEKYKKLPLQTLKFDLYELK